MTQTRLFLSAQTSHAQNEQAANADTYQLDEVRQLFDGRPTTPLTLSRSLSILHEPLRSRRSSSDRDTVQPYLASHEPQTARHQGAPPVREPWPQNVTHQGPVQSFLLRQARLGLQLPPRTLGAPSPTCIRVALDFD
jgi:hypothetical protein